MKNILVTSISEKVPLIEKLKEARDKFDISIKIIGSDIKEEVLAKYFVDDFYLMTRISLLKKEEFYNICQQKLIKYVIPTRDEDLLYFSKWKDYLLKKDIYVFSPAQNIVELCMDKLEFSKLPNTIPSTLYVDKFSKKRYVLKDRFGSGSSSIYLNISVEDSLRYKNNIKNPIYQEYIKGDEYSIDSYLNKDGFCIASIIRSRDLILRGEAKITTRVIDKQMEIFAKRFLEKNKILGHSVLQLIKKNKEYHIIECNTRFGGASTLSYTLGLESFHWFLKESNNEKIDINISSKRLKQIRIQKDNYIEC